jgi:hypothetical protein
MLTDNPKGPAEGTTEHATLENEMGFGYWKVLGECIYAYERSGVERWRIGDIFVSHKSIATRIG